MQIRNDFQSSKFNKYSLIPQKKTNDFDREKASIAVMAKPSGSLLNAYYVTSTKINFEGINILKISDEFKSNEADIKNELEIFDEVGDNAIFLGEGLWAQAYSLEKYPFAVKSMLKDEASLPEQAKKVIREKGMDFLDMEIEGMTLADKSISDTQKFVAKAVSDDGTKYLVSTMVKGKVPDPESMPWTKTHFKSLFDKMFEMDKKGVFHGDLNSGNIKLTKDGEVNFIDYQWTTKVDPYSYFEENQVQEFPRFRFLENNQMFQMSGLSSYLKKLDDNQVTTVFKEYIQAKSNYHKQRKEHLEGLLPNWQWESEKNYIRKAIDYENVQYELFKNPTDEVLSIEAQKLDMKASFRTAFTQTDKMITTNNLLAGPTACFYGLYSAQNFRSDLKSKRNNYNSRLVDKYLDHNIEEADYWINKQKKGVADSFYYLKEDLENRIPLLKNRDLPIKDFGSSPVLAHKINPNLRVYSNNSLNLYYSSSLTELGGYLKGNNKYLYKSRNKSLLSLKKLKNELKSSFYMLSASYKNDNYLDFFTASLYGQFCAQNCLLKLKSISKESLNPHEKTALDYEQKLLKKISKAFLDISNSSYDEIYESLSTQGKQSYPKYIGMNDFNIEITQENKDYAKRNFMS